jgi:cobalt-zinc-cadmium efflux system membrane fusion protein
MKNDARLAALLAAAALCASAVHAADDAFAVSDDELDRLGVRLGRVESVEVVELASGPAEVVVPPSRQALVSAPLGGVVARLLVAEGEAVTLGQVLAELDSTDYLDRQRGYLDAAAAAELAAAQEARDRGLYDEGVIAERRLVETAAAARAARALLDQARAQLELAGLTAADLTRLVAQRRLTARIVLRAPLAGVIAAAHGDVGGRVDALDPVFAVADLSELWLELQLPQENAARVAPGMGVAVEPPGGVAVTGVITTVGGVVDPDTQMVLVRAAVDNHSGALRAGQFLNARIVARPPGSGAFAVPAAAVTRHGGETLLFVRSGAQVLVRRVDVLANDGARIYVAAGVDADAVVAVDGISALKALWLARVEEGG